MASQDSSHRRSGELGVGDRSMDRAGSALRSSQTSGAGAEPGDGQMEGHQQFSAQQPRPVFADAEREASPETLILAEHPRPTGLAGVHSTERRQQIGLSCPSSSWSSLRPQPPQRHRPLPSPGPRTGHPEGLVGVLRLQGLPGQLAGPYTFQRENSLGGTHQNVYNCL